MEIKDLSWNEVTTNRFNNPFSEEYQGNNRR